jgi:hypothetical protein
MNVGRDLVAPTIAQNGTDVNLIHTITFHVTFTLGILIDTSVIKFASRSMSSQMANFKIRQR